MTAKYEPTTAQPGIPPAAMPTSTPADSVLGGVPVVLSGELLRGKKEVVIAHNGSIYRLQTTRQGKLILIK